MQSDAQPCCANANAGRRRRGAGQQAASPGDAMAGAESADETFTVENRADESAVSTPADHVDGADQTRLRQLVE